MSEEEKKAIRNLENLSEFGLSATLNQADLDKMKIVLNLIEKQQKEIEKTKEEYNSLIHRIENKIDNFDYKFEKAKRRNDKKRADYYWDLIINLKKLLEE